MATKSGFVTQLIDALEGTRYRVEQDTVLGWFDRHEAVRQAALAMRCQTSSIPRQDF